MKKGCWTCKFKVRHIWDEPCNSCVKSKEYPKWEPMVKDVH